MLLSTLGIGLASLYGKLFVTNLPPISHYNLYVPTYTLLGAAVIGLLFGRRKAATFKSLLLRDRQLSGPQLAARKALATALTYREGLMQKLKPNDIVLFDSLTNAYLEHAIHRMSAHLKLTIDTLSLEVIQHILAGFYKNQGLDEPTLVFKKDTQKTTLDADFTQFKKLMTNAIEYLQKHNSQRQPITIALEDATLSYSSPDPVSTVEAIRITITTEDFMPATQQSYTVDLNAIGTWTPQAEDEHLLLENARITEAHHSYMATRSSHHQVYVWPAKLLEIQDKIVTLLQAPEEAQIAVEMKAFEKDQGEIPGMAELEQSLFEKIRETKIDPKVVQSALALVRQAYTGRKRRIGESHIFKAITVALTVLNHTVDKEQEIILAALLKDTAAYANLSLQDIEENFGKTVAFLVGKLTPTEDKGPRISLPDQERLARIADYEDTRIDLIRVADRLCLMHDIQHHPYVAERIYEAQETLKEFVPLARALKLADIEKELEQISRKILTNSQE
jgi:hypothetical protein